MATAIRIIALAPVLALLGACGGASDSGSSPQMQLPLAVETSGLNSQGLVLDFNGRSMSVSSNGSMTFTLTALSAYSVTVATQPMGQTCTVTNGSGTVTAQSAGVSVTCVTNTYSVGGSIAGLAQNGLVLTDNGGNALSVSSGATAFTFSGQVAYGNGYAVASSAQPVGQTCVVANGAGIATSAVTNVAVSCTNNYYAVGGAVSGMLGSGLALQLNGGATLPIGSNGAFTFPGAIASGSAYVVTVSAQPAGPVQTCVLNGASGTVVGSAITNVIVTCTSAPTQFSYLGTHAGIYCFAVDAVSDALVPLATPQCDSGIRTAVAADPSGQFVFATDITYTSAPPAPPPTNGGVRMYRIDSTTGGLVPLNGPEPSTQNNPVAIVVDLTGRFVYVANYGSDSSDSVSGYAIDPTTGLLTELPGSPFAAGPHASFTSSSHISGVNALAIDPADKFLYTANQGSEDVSAFAINASTGALTPVPGSPFAVGNPAGALTVDAAGRFVFVGAGDGLDQDTVSVFRIDSGTGALSQVSGSPFTVGYDNPGVAVDARGAFLYVTSGRCPHLAPSNTTYLCNSILGYAIDPSTGALSPLPGFPVADPGVPGNATVQGRVLYVSNGGDGTISMFSINEGTGALTQISGSPVIASGTGSSGEYGISFAP